MKATVLYKKGLIVEDNIEVPDSGMGQILVKVARALIGMTGIFRDV